MHFTMFCDGALGPAVVVVVVILLHASELPETWVPYSPEQKGKSNIVAWFLREELRRLANLRVYRTDDCSELVTWGYY